MGWGCGLEAGAFSVFLCDEGMGCCHGSPLQGWYGRWVVFPGRRPSPTRGLPWAVLVRPVGAEARMRCPSVGVAGPSREWVEGHDGCARVQQVDGRACVGG